MSAAIHGRILTIAVCFVAMTPSTVTAQSLPVAYTSYVRYDVAGRVIGTIAPDPDGVGSQKFLATRTTYNAEGLPTKLEQGELSEWKSEDIDPESWGNAFTVHTTILSAYDGMGLKVSERRIDSTLNPVSLTQYSYDVYGRLECTAVRMNPATYDTLPASACLLTPAGAYGPDRVTKAIYDDLDQILQVRKAVGTSLEIADVTYSYTPNGKIEYVVDANGNRAKLEYDGFDRKSKWIFPSKTRPTAFNPSTPANALATAGSLNTADYEQYGYDANGNRTSLRKRDGSIIGYSYDALNRMTMKDLPSRADLPAVHRRDVYYTYDLRGLQTQARLGSESGQGITYTYDGFGRLTSERQNFDGVSLTVSSQYDANSNRTRITHPDGQYFQFSYNGLDQVSTIFQAATHLGTIGYNSRGLPERLAWTYEGVFAANRNFGYDSAGRPAWLELDFDSTNMDARWSYTRNPASQITSLTQNNDSYSWNGHVDVTRNYAANGLNQYTGAGSASFCYDANGNLTADGTSVYLYDIENRLVEKRAQGSGNTNCGALAYTGTLQAELRYDPTGRLYQVSGGSQGTQRFLYDGNALIAEYETSGTMLRRYLHGSNVEADDPLIVFEGASVDALYRRFLHANHQGSIVAVTNYRGAWLYANSYDEYGIPDVSSGNDIATKGRFRYTGQAWIPELRMYYYKARIYSPTLGRFMQTDPIGYEDQFNLYAYVRNDPINAVDPTGEDTCTRDINGSTICIPTEDNVIVVSGTRTSSGVSVGSVASAIGNVALAVVPGGDLARCTFGSQSCSGLDWTLAIFDIAPGIGKLGRLGILGKLGRACGCVVAGTLVATPTGLVAIETLEVGDMVLAYDVATGEVVPQPVSDLLRTEPKPTYDVVLRAANGETARFEATDDHPWLNAAKEWRKTEELAVGEWLIAGDGDRFEVLEVGLTGDVEEAYTLTVDELHTYIMGEAGIVVHNAKCNKATSPVWKNLKSWRGKTKTDGNKRYEWDNTHGDIEVYDKRGNHLGTMDPESGEMIKDPVKGRTLGSN